MNEPFAVGDYLCWPYHPFSGDLSKNDLILDTCAAHPERFTLPMTRNDIRTTAAWYLTDPDNMAWEVWQGGTFSGILLLDHVVPRLDARWHFVFFDANLIGKQQLLREFLRRAFDELPLERISLEIPANVASLISFARRKLGFRYEGETDLPIANMSPVWIARMGSRREHAYFDGTTWHDIMLLRLLKGEQHAA